MIEKNPVAKFNFVVKHSGCDDRKTYDEQCECLRGLPHQQFVEIARKLIGAMSFMPHVDGVFLPSSPTELAIVDRFRHVSMIKIM